MQGKSNGFFPGTFEDGFWRMGKSRVSEAVTVSRHERGEAGFPASPPCFCDRWPSWVASPQSPLHPPEIRSFQLSLMNVGDTHSPLTPRNPGCHCRTLKYSPLSKTPAYCRFNNRSAPVSSQLAAIGSPALSLLIGTGAARGPGCVLGTAVKSVAVSNLTNT